MRNIPAPRLHLTYSTAGARWMSFVGQGPAPGRVRRDAGPPRVERRMACRGAALGMEGERRSGGPRCTGGVALRPVAAGQSATPLTRRRWSRSSLPSSTAPPTPLRRITPPAPMPTRPSTRWLRTGSADRDRARGCSSQQSTGRSRSRSDPGHAGTACDRLRSWNHCYGQRPTGLNEAVRGPGRVRRGGIVDVGAWSCIRAAGTGRSSGERSGPGAADDRDGRIADETPSD